MKTWHCSAIYTEDRWLNDAYITVDAQGIIQQISTHKPTQVDERLEGWLMPGFINAHSHAFQYAMAGLTEGQLPQQDDFWLWRETMYRIANSIDPDMLFAIACQLYADLLIHGYTHVIEFHYLHHDQKGKPYAAPALLAECLIRAAQTVGMGLTLLPVCYQQSNFNQPARDEQRRFLTKDLDDYLALWHASEKICQQYQVPIGVALHSLRAVNTDVFKNVCAYFSKHQIPIHAHAAEQSQEINDCIKALDRRPIEWLLENIALSSNYFFVHSTHINAQETQALANSPAHVVLCPTTEGNLGDGLFPLLNYFQQGGTWTIGGDSHIGLSPFEELRWMDYLQRLQLQKRNVLCINNEKCSATLQVQQVLTTGAAAAGCPIGTLKPGFLFSALLINKEHPLLKHTPIANRLATFVYAHQFGMLLGTITQGKMRVQQQRHHAKETIETQSIHALKTLREPYVR